MSDFKPLSTANLPDPAIDPAAGKEPTEYFNAVLYSGNSSTQSVTGVGHQPDFLWIKNRNGTQVHQLFDVVRGVASSLRSNSNDTENTDSPNDRLTSFDSDGFSLGDDGNPNGSSNTYVAWSWKAGGTGVSNTDGSITSTVSANTDAGFSVVKWSGNSTAGATIGHGLNSAVDLVLSKCTNVATNWSVYHRSLGGTKHIHLDLTNAAVTSNSRWNDTDPSSSVITLGSDGDVNLTNRDYIAYCFHSVDGFSKIGAYEENYVSNYEIDSPFVYTGFAPAWIMIKSADGARPWVIYDNERETYNSRDTWLQANTTHAEQTDATNHDIDFLSNGFKIRGGSGDINTTGETYIFLAFAEAPFKYSTAR